MTKEGNTGAPEFAFIQVKAQTGLAGTLENSTKIFIMVAKVTVVAIYNNVICDSSYTGKSPKVSSTFLWKTSCTQIKPKGNCRNLYLPNGELKAV